MLTHAGGADIAILGDQGVMTIQLKFAALPKTAADYESWFFNASDAVSACAIDGDAAFRMMARIENPSCTFEELSVDSIPTKHRRLVAKIRLGVTKHMSGAEKDKNKKLVTYLEKRRQEMAREDVPRQISGLQFVWLIKRYFMIHDTERVQYELSSLMEVEYPGDAQLDTWKTMLIICCGA